MSEEFKEYKISKEPKTYETVKILKEMPHDEVYRGASDDLELRADNTVIKPSDEKKENYDIDIQIYAERKKIKKLDSLEDNIYSMKKNLDSVIELLGKSIKGGNIAQKLSVIEAENNDSVKSLKNYVINEKSKSESKIRELYKEKDKKDEMEQKKQEE